MHGDQRRATPGTAVQQSPGTDGLVADRMPARIECCHARYSRSPDVTSTTWATTPSSASSAAAASTSGRIAPVADQRARPGIAASSSPIAPTVDEPVATGEHLATQHRSSPTRFLAASNGAWSSGRVVSRK